MTIPDAVLCVPSLRDVHILTVKGLLDAYATGRYEVLFHYNDAIMSRTRARLVTRFLTEYPEVQTMVFIDSDMVFETKALNDLVSLSVMHKSIIGGVYPTRGEGQTTVNLLPHSSITIGPDRTNPERVRSIGTGFMAVPRDVLMTLNETVDEVTKNTAIPYFPIFNHIMEDGAELAEDTSFCRRAEEAGFVIYAMRHHQIGHVGDHIFRISPGTRLEG